MLALRVMNRNRVLLYGQHLRIVAQGYCTSSGTDGGESGKTPEVKETSSTSASMSWLDIRTGIFGPYDSRLSLPGDVGFYSSLTPPISLNRPKSEKDILMAHLNALQKSQAMTLKVIESMDPEFQFAVRKVARGDKEYILTPTLEFRITKLSKEQKKDFKELFPSRCNSDKPLTFMTISFRTKNNMTAWSEDMDEEREILAQQFNFTATGVCNAFKAQGYWSDFIDSSSGRPFYGEYTNATLFETDETLSKYDFEIEQSGCCKMIKHSVWDYNIFVGFIFTDAPVRTVATHSLLTALFHNEYNQPNGTVDVKPINVDNSFLSGYISDTESEFLLSDAEDDIENELENSLLATDNKTCTTNVTENEVKKIDETVIVNDQDNGIDDSIKNPKLMNAFDNVCNEKQTELNDKFVKSKPNNDCTIKNTKTNGSDEHE